MPVDSVILHWYACGADGRSGGRSLYGHVITKFSRMGSLPHFLPHGAPLLIINDFIKGQVSLEWTPSGPRVSGAGRNFFKNFGSYINVLRIRFGLETTLADKIFGWTGRTY